MPSTVAYLGPEKTNTHLAARKKFGSQCRYIHAPTVEDVFHMVERESVDFGVVPIENSLEGAVTHTLDRFIDFKRSPAKIYGEIQTPIGHYLIRHRSAGRDKIKAIYSHPQAFAQCRQWLDKNFRGVPLVETSSTADAIDRIVKPMRAFQAFSGKTNEIAAIGRKELADQHGLQTVPIPIDRENLTRFLVISLRSPKCGRKNKTSILFALKDKPGALHDALMPFKDKRINLTKIESRPSKRKAWEYVFFVDLEGHELEPRIKQALDALKKSTSDLRVLGSYPVHAS